MQRSCAGSYYLATQQLCCTGSYYALYRAPICIDAQPENGKASWRRVTETDSEARHVGQACSEARHVGGGLIDSVAQVVSYGFEFINRYYWLRVYLGEDASEIEICYPRRVFTVVGVDEECQAAHLSELCHLKPRMISCVTRLAFPTLAVGCF